MITKLFNYIRPTIEGDDEKLSYRRITAFAVMVLICYSVIKGFSNQFQVNALYALILFFLGITGIITADHIIKYKKSEK